MTMLHLRNLNNLKTKAGACSVTVIGMKSGIDKQSSKFDFVYCIHLHAKTYGKSINPSLLFQHLWVK